MRIGFDNINGLQMAKLVEQSGAELLVVHGRTVKQMYKGDTNYDEIANIKANLKIPVLANGNIDSFKKAQWVMKYTKCDGVMVGRGAIGNPWIFKEIKENRLITQKEKKDIIIEHFRAMLEWYGEYAVVLFRKHLHTYSKGYNGASEFRTKINTISSSKELSELIDKFF
jgi:tRNA-dihydrouridine synthase B